jgi:hypothetical protein
MEYDWDKPFWFQIRQRQQTILASEAHVAEKNDNNNNSIFNVFAWWFSNNKNNNYYNYNNIVEVMNLDLSFQLILMCRRRYFSP